MKEIYLTKELANKLNVHPNTIRFYEEIGFITKPERKANGYREYTSIHLLQGKLIRVALRGEVLQNKLREKAIEIIKNCANGNISKALTNNQEYQVMIESEIKRAKEAIKDIESLKKEINYNVTTSRTYNRKEAANELNVTTETIRTWERNGLISINRKANGYREYNQNDIIKLNIIRTLRMANYSIASIHRLFTYLLNDDNLDIERILDTPLRKEDIISTCDHLITSLMNTLDDTKEIEKILKQINPPV